MVQKCLLPSRVDANGIQGWIPWDWMTIQIPDGTQMLETRTVRFSEITSCPNTSTLRASRGQVLFVNSMAGLQSNAGWSAYAASKFALRAFTDALDAEERPNGVRVMGVYPGRTATAMQLKVRAQEGAEYEPETYTQPETLANTIKIMLETPRDSVLTQVIVSRMG